MAKPSGADKRAAFLANIKSRAGDQPAMTPGKTGMNAILDFTGRLKAAEAELSALKNKQIAIADIVEVEGRRRHLTDVQFQELKANIQNFGLVHPILVRRLDQGKYELVAGHNRLAASIELGHTEIEADIRDIADDKVGEGAFYSNLFNSPLSDFEKFKGFALLQEQTGETQEQLAARAGVGQSAISRLFSFAKLPKAALDVLRLSPECLGASCAAELAKAPKAIAVDAVQKLSAGEITERQAVAMVNACSAPVSAPVVEPIVIRAGKVKFAEIKTRGNLLAITIKDEALVSTIASEIEKVLRRTANG